MLATSMLLNAPLMTQLNTALMQTTATSVSVNQMKNTEIADMNKQPTENIVEATIFQVFHSSNLLCQNNFCLYGALVYLNFGILKRQGEKSWQD